jgi:TonB-linked SusC/RagA family outer membrane protein
MKKLKFILLICSASLGVAAQEIVVRGTVTSAEDGQALPGVTVMVKESSTGTITDANGVYQLSVAPDAILKYSFIGMQTTELPVENRSEIDLAMQVESTGLEEVVVIGYGTIKKKDVTGAVSIVDSETIEQIRPAKVEQALQGTMAGVNVTTQSGAPGAGLDIRIRGISTNGDASPVVIIDGYQGDLNTISPSDIETITVLKDAQAAIYGTVGANGIILITTKSGRKNTPTRVSFNSSYGVQETTRKLSVLNATEYAVLLNESYAANGEQIPYPDISGLGVGTDWQSSMFSTAPVYNNDLTISGGSESIVYSMSVSSFNQKGIIGGDKSAFKRNTARLNVGIDLAKWLHFESTLNYTLLNRTSINDFGLASVLFNALNMPSTVPIFDETGAYFLAPSNLGIEIINPLAQIDNTYNDYDLKKLNGNFGLDFDIAPNIVATTRIGFNTADTKYKSFSRIVDYGGKVFDVTRSSVYQSKDYFNDYTFDAFITYENTFQGVHHLTATLGTTVYKTWGDNLNATGFDVPNNSWEFADIGLANGLNTSKATGSWTYDQRRLSYFTRLQYDYLGKYLVSAMLRRDASTKFGPDNSVAWFPSATLGWIVSDESFMAEAEKIDLLKFRLSYGVLGSDKIGDYQYISQLSGEGTYVFQGMLVNGKAVGASPNPAVKWEQSEQFDVGLDMKLLRNRIDFSADYFIKTTNNLLISNIPVSGILGTTAPGAAGPTANAGTVRNSGFEFAIGFKGNIKEDFSYGINYNLTTLKNEVLEVNNGTGFVEGGSFGVGQPYPARMEVGLPIGYFYGYKSDGLFQNQEEVDAHPSQTALGAQASPGDIRYVDVNKDGKLDASDRTHIGDPIPKVVMGLNINLNYKGFDFVIYTFASIGNEMVRNYERVQPNVNRLSYYMSRWTGEGTSSTVPRLTTAATGNTIFSDFYVEDASFLRIQNIQLGYTIPQSFTQKAKIQTLKIYVAVSNPLTVSRYMGYDPSASSGSPIGGGFDPGFYPVPRTYNIGLNLNF